MSRYRSRFSAGDWVEVLSAEEILATLDERGEVDSLPFMPEMLRYCGLRFQVSKSAHKTCDTIKKVPGQRGRKMPSAVHLAGTRCDGAGHGGCQAACLIFWKDDWLKAVDAPSQRSRDQASTHAGSDALNELLSRNASTVAAGESQPTYSCQTTRLYDATSRLPTWHPVQYWQDFRSGNERPGEILKVLLLAVVYRLRELPVGYRFSRWLYNNLHQLLQAAPSPYIRGALPAGGPTPKAALGLQAGDLVEVKSPEEIAATIDIWNRNRGMGFDKEMTPYCGMQFRVQARVDRIIGEQDGRMVTMKTPAFILEGAYCRSRYSEGRLLCPRQIPSFWREIWLKRVEQAGSSNDGA